MGVHTPRWNPGERRQPGISGRTSIRPKDAPFSGAGALGRKIPEPFMAYRHTIDATTYVFGDLRELLA